MTKIQEAQDAVQSLAFGRWCFEFPVNTQHFGFFLTEHNKLVFWGRGYWHGLPISASVWSRLRFMFLFKDVGYSWRKNSSGPNDQCIKLQNFTDDPDLGVLPLGMIWIFIYFIISFIFKFF